MNEKQKYSDIYFGLLIVFVNVKLHFPNKYLSMQINEVLFNA